MDRLKFKVRRASIIKRRKTEKHQAIFRRPHKCKHAHKHTLTAVIECKLKCKCGAASSGAADGAFEHDSSDKFGMSKSGVALNRVFTRLCQIQKSPSRNGTVQLFILRRFSYYDSEHQQKCY